MFATVELNKSSVVSIAGIKRITLKTINANANKEKMKLKTFFIINPPRISISYHNIKYNFFVTLFIRKLN